MTTQAQRISRGLLAAMSLSGMAVAGMAQAADAQRAVQATNFEFGLTASDSDTKGSTSNGTFGLSGAAIVPLGPWFGASLEAGISRTTARTSAVLVDTESNTTRPSCRFNNVDASASVFARRPTLGKVAVSYGQGQLESDCGAQSVFLGTGTDKLDTDHIKLALEAYLWDFTVFASRTTTELENGPELDSDAYGVAWYPFNSLKVTLSGGQQYDQDIYGIELEHQPEFMGDGLSVTLGYSVLDREQEIGTISFGVFYHFGTKVPLKIRDREYR